MLFTLNQKEKRSELVSYYRLITPTISFQLLVLAEADGFDKVLKF